MSRFGVFQLRAPHLSVLVYVPPSGYLLWFRSVEWALYASLDYLSVSLLALLTLSNIEGWEMIIGIAGICAMGGDKLLAVFGWDRISEKTLHIIALLGGFWGIIFGAFLFRHKRSKPEFWPPVLFATAVWIILFFALLFGYIRLSEA